MRQRLAYPYRKLMDAVQVLAISPESIQKRLEVALANFKTLKAEDFPALLQSRYRDIVDKVGPILESNGCRLASARLAQMSDADARNVARLIYELFLDVAQIHGGRAPRGG